MKIHLLNYKLLLCSVALLFTGSTWAQTTVTVTADADTWIRSDNTSQNKGDATTMEIHYDGTNDFLGLIRFTLPDEALASNGAVIKSATLRIVSERKKGASTINIYKYGNDFTETSATWTTESDYVATAKENKITSFTMNGTSASIALDNITSTTYQDISAWTNTIDLTNYVMEQAYSNQANCNLMLGIDGTNSNQDCFFTREQTDFTNSNLNLTFSATDVVPQLTIVYTTSTLTTSTATPTKDTWIRSGNTATHGSEATMEFQKTSSSQMAGLMAFEIPEAALSANGGIITSATLRLVSERKKGDGYVDIFAYGNDFDENTTYATEESYVTEAEAEDPIVTFTMNGQSGKSTTDSGVSGEYVYASGWTNTIDLTDYIKAQGEASNSSVSFLIQRSTEVATSNKFYTKEATDVTNSNLGITFSADSLIPQLTITYYTSNYVTLKDDHTSSYTDMNDVTVKMVRPILANSWNAICLPFDMTAAQVQEAFGSDTKVATMTNATEDVIEFITSDSQAMTAGTPYMIYPSMTESLDSFTVSNVSIAADVTAGETTGTSYNFVGTLNKITPSTSSCIIFSTSKANTYYTLSDGGYVKAFRGYLSPNSANAKAATILFDGMNTTTSIDKVNTDVTEPTGKMYNLMGQEVDDSYHGVVIQNGHKYLKK
jgi:hypothetical protein